MNMLVYDVIILVILAAFVLLGIKKGFVLSLCGALALVVALVGASIGARQLAPQVSQALEPRFAAAIEEQLNQEIAYVSQDNYLFDRTIRDNIRMGKLNATDAEVEAVAKAAGCAGFIRKLDKGYDTICGEGGGHLSGGEKQRISIARAMLKNAKIVILDEATASIDPENEAMIQKAISALTKGKTLIVIAHRLGTIIDADNIVVVQDGHIEAQGTHEQLKENCPLYSKMWNSYLGVRDVA